MNPERFDALAEMYGGDVTRWPVSDREAAAAFMAADPVGAQAALSRAADLDALLNAVAPPHGALGLAERIAAGAPRARRGWSWLLPAGMGAGLAAACAAGVVAGVHLSAAQPPASDGESVMTAVSDDGFGDLDEEA